MIRFFCLSIWSNNFQYVEAYRKAKIVDENKKEAEKAVLICNLKLEIQWSEPNIQEQEAEVKKIGLSWS